MAARCQEKKEFIPLLEDANLLLNEILIESPSVSTSASLCVSPRVVREFRDDHREELAAIQCRSHLVKRDCREHMIDELRQSGIDIRIDGSAYHKRVVYLG